MSQLQVSARFKIHEGNQDEFRAVAERCIAIVNEKDDRCQQYDWFFSADGTECVVRETYPDSAALLDHIGLVGEELGALIALGDLHVELYGDPSPELAEATAGLSTSVYSHHASATELG